MSVLQRIKAIWLIWLMRGPGFLAAMWFVGRLRKLDGRRINARSQAAGEFIAMFRRPGMSYDPVLLREASHKLKAIMGDNGPVLPVTYDAAIPGLVGQIDLRVFDTLDAETPRPTLVYLHGGGWVQGDLDTYHGVTARLAKYSGLRVISVAYRLAPENPWPAGPDDVLALHNWLQTHGAELGVDPSRLAYGGDSAGGNLTAVLMQDLNLAGRPLPSAQVLIYPAVDLRMKRPIFDYLANAYLLTTELARWFRDQYVPHGADMKDPRLSPIFSQALARQPQAYVLTAGHDLLRPEGEDYVDRLRDAGVSVTHVEEEGEIHGFINLSRVTPRADAALKRIGQWLVQRV